MKFVGGMSHSSDSNSGHVGNRCVSACYFTYMISETVYLCFSGYVIDITEPMFICFERLLGFKNGSVLFVWEEKSSSPEIYFFEHLLSLGIFVWIEFSKHLRCSLGVSHIEGLGPKGSVSCGTVTILTFPI